MKAGDKVVCIDEFFLKGLTKGQTYLVKQVEGDDLWIFDDDNRLHRFPARLFESKLHRLPARLFESAERGVIVVTDIMGVKSIRTVTKPNYVAKMLEACKANIRDWDKHTPEDQQAIAEDGMYEHKDGVLVVVIWLNDNGDYNTETY